MISKRERKQIKKHLGAQYTSEVLSLLKQANITNKLGNPHSAEYVVMVLNGVRYNADVETALYELVKIKKLEKAKREAILEN